MPRVFWLARGFLLTYINIKTDESHKKKQRMNVFSLDYYYKKYYICFIINNQNLRL